MQVGGQGRDDVVERLGHRGKGVVGSEDDVVAAEDVDRCIQGWAVVCQTVAPELAGQPAWQVGRVCGHAGDGRPFVEASDYCR
jgi:hypothetical protein